MSIGAQSITRFGLLQQGADEAFWSWAAAIMLTLTAILCIYWFQRLLCRSTDAVGRNGDDIPTNSTSRRYDLPHCPLLLVTCSQTCKSTWAATGAILTLTACLTTVAYDGGCQETLQQHGITLQEVLGRGMFGMVYKGESQKCCITSLCSREVHRQ
jgi:hypothetical protein